MECEICVTDSSMCLSFSFRLQWLRGHHKSRSDGNARRKFCRFLFSSHTPLHAHWLSPSCEDSCVKSLSCSCFCQHASIYLFVEKEGTPSVSQDGGRWGYEMHSMYYNSGHYLQWWKPTDSKEFLQSRRREWRIMNRELIFHFLKHRGQHSKTSPRRNTCSNRIIVRLVRAS